MRDVIGRATRPLSSLAVVLANTLLVVALGAAFGDPQKVIDACENDWEANKADCNKFVRAVGSSLSVSIPAGDADQILDGLAGAAGWTALPAGDGPRAKQEADNGNLVVGGLKGSELMPAQSHGHVLVVVSGPLDPTYKKYPTAYWGRLGGVGAKKKTVNYSFKKADRDRVRYYSHAVP